MSYNQFCHFITQSYQKVIFPLYNSILNSFVKPENLMFTDNHISQDMTKFMTKVQFIFDQQLQKQFHSYDLPNIDIQQFITNNPHLMDEFKKLVKELPKERIPFDFLHFEKGDDIPERDLIPFINLVISGDFNFLDHC